MKLSVIIPIYNVDKYLKRCINSILKQDGFHINSDNIEILLINDGSTDNSQNIIEQYAFEYDFIKGFKKNNGGLSDARNFGLHRATGDYIWFIDSDDWVDSKSFITIFNEIENNHLDILEFDSYRAREQLNGKISLSLDEFYHSISTDQINGIEALEAFGYIVGVCFKIIKKQIFTDNGLLFPLGKLNEDYIISYQLMRCIHKYKKIALPLYYYYCRPESITNNVDRYHLYQYIRDQISNILFMTDIINNETFSTIKIKEMQFFYTTNVLLRTLKLKDAAFLMEQIDKLERVGLYPIKRYAYHNTNLKRKMFIELINKKRLIIKLLKSQNGLIKF